MGNSLTKSAENILSTFNGGNEEGGGHSGARREYQGDRNVLKDEGEPIEEEPDSPTKASIVFSDALLNQLGRNYENKHNAQGHHNVQAAEQEYKRDQELAEQEYEQYLLEKEQYDQQQHHQRQLQQQQYEDPHQVADRIVGIQNEFITKLEVEDKEYEEKQKEVELMLAANIATTNKFKNLVTQSCIRERDLLTDCYNRGDVSKCSDLVKLYQACSFALHNVPTPIPTTTTTTTATTTKQTATAKK